MAHCVLMIILIFQVLKKLVIRGRASSIGGKVSR